LGQLRTRDLYNAQITDAGLEHLKPLSQLQELLLGGKCITDAGLERLRGLSQLQKLSLPNTGVTEDVKPPSLMAPV
jgi:hypothetical protein